MNQTEESSESSNKELLCRRERTGEEEPPHNLGLPFNFSATLWIIITSSIGKGTDWSQEEEVVQLARGGHRPSNNISTSEMDILNPDDDNIVGIECDEDADDPDGGDLTLYEMSPAVPLEPLLPVMMDTTPIIPTTVTISRHQVVSIPVLTITSTGLHHHQQQQVTSASGITPTFVPVVRSAHHSNTAPIQGGIATSVCIFRKNHGDITNSNNSPSPDVKAGLTSSPNNRSSFEVIHNLNIQQSESSDSLTTGKNEPIPIFSLPSQVIVTTQQHPSSQSIADRLQDQIHQQQHAVPLSQDDDDEKILLADIQEETDQQEGAAAAEGGGGDLPEVQEGENVLVVSGDDQLFICSVCNKNFVSLERLRSHEKTHTKTRPFKCTDCGKSFTVRYSLICHTRVHTRERPYICTACGSRFSQASSLKTHQIYKHTKEFPYECKTCGRGFISPGQRHEHVARTHLKVSGGRRKPNRRSKQPPKHAIQTNTSNSVATSTSDHVVEEGEEEDEEDEDGDDEDEDDEEDEVDHLNQVLHSPPQTANSSSSQTSSDVSCQTHLSLPPGPLDY